MTSREVLRRVASEIQLFNDIEQKETFLFVLGALFSRVISLKKAAEIMEMESDTFLELLELMKLEFSYLTQQDVALEKNVGCPSNKSEKPSSTKVSGLTR
ncbi:MAG TPA: hypothetical protein V6C91_03690 [Coleofasciculaceae cyanobacterium]